MIHETKSSFLEKNVSIKDITITDLVDDYFSLYMSDSFSDLEKLEYLDFINTLFKLKHKFILEINTTKEHSKRDMKLFYLKKIQRFAKIKFKRIRTKKYTKELKHNEDVVYFKKIVTIFKRRAKASLSEKTKNLLKELLKEKWTIKDKTKLLNLILNKNEEVNFETMLDTEEKEELVKSLAAILDLAKNNKIELEQKQNFGEIIIKRKAEKLQTG